MNGTTLEVRGDREIVIARAFDAPARIVFEAWTNPELVSRWWAPRALGVSVVTCEADVRVGGRYRYVFRPAGAGEMAFSGEYLEVTPPSRLVYTQVFEPTASGAQPEDQAIVVTVTFEERDGRTHLVSRSLCPSRDVRDAIIASGMERGMRESMQQLEVLLTTRS
jgi:uncharacterized protein YndB with AHSA1/START domain